MTRPKIVVAAKILVYINGKLFGRCTSFSWSSMTPRKKIRTIDIQHPVELAATTVDIGWQMGVLRTIGDGGLQGAGVVAQQSDLSREKYFTIQLVERTSGLTLFRSDLNNTDAEQWGVTAKGLLSGTANGSGILWVNETAQ
jgi:hypothetical protein